MNKEDLSNKPLARAPICAAARATMKKAKKEGKSVLCDSCQVDEYVVCPATGHVICTKRKDFGWMPAPFGAAACGLYVRKEKETADA